MGTAVKDVALKAAAALLAAALLHVAISFAAATVAASYSKRVFKTSEFGGKNLAVLVGSYIEARLENDKSIIAGGSSFSFGYPFPAEFAWPAQLGEQLREPVVNAGVIASGADGIRQAVMCQMSARGLKTKTLILEVPLVNELSSLKASRGGPTCSIQDRRSLVRFALENAIGLKWVDALRDEYAATADRPEIAIAPLPDNYFATPDHFERVKDVFAQNMAFDFAKAKEVAAYVYLFVTPVYIPGVAEGGGDAAEVERQFKFAEAACVEIAADRCIETGSMLFTRELYANLTHLNRAGHAEMARLVAATLAR